MTEKEKLKEKRDEALLHLEQSEHRVQILENRKRYLERKDARERTHHLCNMGGAIQSISREADALTKTQFYLFMEKVFSLEAVHELLATAAEETENGGDG